MSAIAAGPDAIGSAGSSGRTPPKKRALRALGFSVAYLALGGFAAVGLVLWLVSLPKVASACAAAPA